MADSEQGDPSRDVLVTSAERFRALAEEVRQRNVEREQAPPRVPPPSSEVDYALDDFYRTWHAIRRRIEDVREHGWPEPPPLPDTLMELTSLRDSLRVQRHEHAKFRTQFAQDQYFLGLDPTPLLKWLDAEQGRLEAARDKAARKYRSRRDHIVGALIADRLRLDPARDLIELTRDTRQQKDEDLETAYAILVERTTDGQAAAPKWPGLRPGPKLGTVDDAIRRDQITQIVCSYRAEHDGDNPLISWVGLQLGYKDRSGRTFGRALRKHFEAWLDPDLEWPPRSWWKRSGSVTAQGMAHVPSDAVPN